MRIHSTVARALRRTNARWWFHAAAPMSVLFSVSSSVATAQASPVKPVLKGAPPATAAQAHNVVSGVHQMLGRIHAGTLQPHPSSGGSSGSGTATPASAAASWSGWFSASYNGRCDAGGTFSLQLSQAPAGPVGAPQAGRSVVTLKQCNSGTTLLDGQLTYAFGDTASTTSVSAWYSVNGTLAYEDLKSLTGYDISYNMLKVAYKATWLQVSGKQCVTVQVNESGTYSVGGKTYPADASMVGDLTGGGLGPTMNGAASTC